MARIRSLKPEFWLDRKLARSLSRDERMLYLGLWNQADEWGRAQADPRLVQGQVFPYDDDITPSVIEAMLTKLAGAGVVVLYEVDDDPYLYLPKLAKHQRLEPAKVPSRLPAPPPQPGDQEVLSFPDDSTPDDDPSGSRAHESAPGSDTSAPDADSSSLSYVAGSRGQGSSSRGQGSGARNRGTRVPEDFVPSDDDRDKARQLGFSLADLDRITASFIDYWRGVPGQKGVKLDWPATWRNWVRKEAERRPVQRHLRPVASASGRGPGVKPWEL